ncbi:MAG: DUF2520 domain-containing protein [Chloroflexota bacterium]|nr:DUF2520 domain-containing protein [Chloroflexota bacterium]
MTAAPLFRDVGFIGAGALASALAVAMHRRGYAVRAVASRMPSSAERLAAEIPGCEAVSPQAVADRCRTVFLTVPDDAIAEVAASVQWRESQIVMHCSGAVSIDALQAAVKGSGARTGSLHPLQTFTAGVDAEAALRGIAYAVEGSHSLLRGAIEMLAKDLGGSPFVLVWPRDRALYHASAIAACGLVATLLKQAADLWRAIPGLEDEGMRALLPLTRSTLDNIERQGLPAALTGPAARGDVGVVRMHLDALAERAPGFLPLYAALSLALLPIARDKGTLGRPQEAQLRELLTASLAGSVEERAPCA